MSDHPHDSADIGIIVHLPECPAPLCDWGSSKAECMGYEDCHHLCCCDALRACEQRVLNTAREAVERASSFMQPLGPALAAIDALREENK